MPGEHKEIEFAIRKAGNLTNKLQQLNEEDNLWLRGPYGHGWFDKSEKRKAKSRPTISTPTTIPNQISC